MYKKQFLKLTEILDREYNAYNELKELFAEKREILKKSRSDDLGVLDNKIIALNNKIQGINKERMDLAVEITGTCPNSLSLRKKMSLNL